jgi:hypothetical protein
MRAALSAAAILSLLLIAGAAPADSLAKAKAEIAQHKLYSADPLLQDVVNSHDSTPSQVEEALVLQSCIYYGDVFGAAFVMAPLAAASSEGSPLKALVSQQLLLARRAFHVAANSYMDTTVAGSQLTQLKLELPPFTDSDLDVLKQGLGNKAALKRILDEYPEDPSAGQGMLAQANHFGLYLAFGAAYPRSAGRKLTDVRSALKAGVAFDELRYLDWIATVAGELAGLVKEPGGPDLSALAKRADERLLKRGASKPDSQFVKNAKQRRGVK